MAGEKQQKEQHKSPWLKDYEWKPGQSGNPKGRPPGKTLKGWASEMLMELPDDKKLEFLKELSPEIVWKMAEGNPHSTSDEKIEVTLPDPIYGGKSNHENQGTDKYI
jgi:hypothetical protein